MSKTNKWFLSFMFVWISALAIGFVINPDKVYFINVAAMCVAATYLIIDHWREQKKVKVPKTLIQEIEQMVYDYIDEHTDSFPEVWIPEPQYSQLVREVAPPYYQKQNGMITLSHYSFKLAPFIPFHRYRGDTIKLYPQGTFATLAKEMR